MTTKSTIQDLVKAAEIDLSKPLVPARYDAEGVEYVNARTKVPVWCSEHGIFWILPRDIERRSYLCRQCRDELKGQKAAQEAAQFATKVRKKFGDQAFDLSELGYVNTQTPVVLICTKHKTRHSIYPFDLDKMKYGCTDCRNKDLKERYITPPEQFLEKAKAKHGQVYDYSKANYNGSHAKITIVCSEHGAFEQTPASHLSGRGCPECGKNRMVQSKLKKDKA